MWLSSNTNLFIKIGRGEDLACRLFAHLALKAWREIKFQRKWQIMKILLTHKEIRLTKKEKKPQGGGKKMQLLKRCRILELLEKNIKSTSIRCFKTFKEVLKVSTLEKNQIKLIEIRNIKIEVKISLKGHNRSIRTEQETSKMAQLKMIQKEIWKDKEMGNIKTDWRTCWIENFSCLIRHLKRQGWENGTKTLSEGSKN